MSKRVIKIPVKIKQGTGILRYTKFQKHLEMLKALANIKNNFAITTITNSSVNPIKLTISEPFEIEHLDVADINFIEKMEVDETCIDEQHDDLLKKNLKNLRLDHCNKEEKNAIRELCFEYRDIFYCEGIPLSFTNKIVHKINLKNDTPIRTKTYRYPEIHRNEVMAQIQNMLSQGIIQPCEKKNGRFPQEKMETRSRL